MHKFTLSLMAAALLGLVGCGESETSESLDSSSVLVVHNQGVGCLDCHGVGSEKEFTSGATVYTNLNAVDSYADGHTVRLVLKNTGTVIDYIPKYGTGNSHTAYAESINAFTAKVLDAEGNVVNSSADYSHDSSQLNCNSCHTQSGTDGAPGRITADMSLTQETLVASVSSDEKTEGTALVHTVALNAAPVTNQNYSFTLGGGTATYTSDYSNAVFSDSVVNNGDGTITVPSGVAAFTITVATVNDTIVESTESYNLAVGGVSAVGTILDNDAVTPTVSFANNVMPIFVANCQSCHSTTSNKTFKVGDTVYTYNNIINNTLINTASPDLSLILIKGNGGDSHNGGDKLSDVNSQTIRDWIAAGGLNN
jgi:mono/diheme cytochrome c family protein